MRFNILTAAIIDVLRQWYIEGLIKQASRPKKLTTEWEELKSEVAGESL